ncbi:MAG: sigma-54-dependent transcriptional regulator [Planctomycetota bacterium]
MSRAEMNDMNQTHRRDDIANVLIVGNDPEIARFILAILARKGIRGHLANDEKAALDFLDRSDCDLVFTGERVRRRTAVKAGGDGKRLGAMSEEGQDGSPASPESGLELLGKIRAISHDLPVVMIGEYNFTGCEGAKGEGRGRGQATGGDYRYDLLRWASVTAVKAVRAGCCEFLVKPLEAERIENLLDTFLPNHGVSIISSAQEDTRCLYRIVGRSAKLVQAVDLAKRVAPTSAAVLISGESGTGKELFSYLVHHESNRAQGPYVKVNCAALSDSLLESELFGHEKGAFTGAHAQRRGRFETAHGGTLLLDEITETPSRFQAKLLRVLEQQDFERVGGNENVSVDVRIISTTNKDLSREVQKGRFRQDLYYRLSGIRLIIAPLRERRQDLPDLVWYFVNLYAREAQRRITRLDPVMMDVFAKCHWPGNVRQLRNVVRTSLILGVGETLSLADPSWLFDGTSFCDDFTRRIPDGVRPHRDISDDDRAESIGDLTSVGHYPPAADLGLGGLRLEQIERRAILDTLRQTAGNQTKAAKVLGISDRTLRDKIRRYRQQGCLQSAG